MQHAGIQPRAEHGDHAADQKNKQHAQNGCAVVDSCHDKKERERFQRDKYSP